jgi:3-hydroxybutyryl-CoA dehydrogenase
MKVVRGPETSDEAIESVYELLTKVGKSPAVVQKEAPGFVGNRLQAAPWRKALSIMEHGIASPQDVDVVIKSSPGRRWPAAGPLKILEVAGWDLMFAAWPYFEPYIESSTEMPSVLVEKVERGELGVKTGKGFHEWTRESAEGLGCRIAQALIEIAQWSSTP